MLPQYTRGHAIEVDYGDTDNIPPGTQYIK